MLIFQDLIIVCYHCIFSGFIDNLLQLDFY